MFWLHYLFLITYFLTYSYRLFLCMYVCICMYLCRKVLINLSLFGAHSFIIGWVLYIAYVYMCVCVCGRVWFGNKQNQREDGGRGRKDLGEKKKRKEISKKKPAPKFFYFILFFIFFSLSFKLPDRCYAMYFVWEANGICTLRINFFYYVNPAPFLHCGRCLLLFFLHNPGAPLTAHFPFPTPTTQVSGYVL